MAPLPLTNVSKLKIMVLVIRTLSNDEKRWMKEIGLKLNKLRSLECTEVFILLLKFAAIKHNQESTLSNGIDTSGTSGSP